MALTVKTSCDATLSFEIPRAKGSPHALQYSFHCPLTGLDGHAYKDIMSLLETLDAAGRAWEARRREERT